MQLRLSWCAYLVLALLPLASPAALSNQTLTDCMYDWLRTIGLSPSPAAQYQQLFRTEEFDERVIQLASLEQLRELGITKLGHRILIHTSLSSKHMCQNGAQCGLTTDSSFQCSCLLGYGGERCQYVIGCGETVCKNGGHCSVSSGVVQCLCSPGFTGSWCEHDVCNLEPCLNGGTCSHSAQGYVCSCPLGFEGIHCQERWLNKSTVEQLTKRVAFLERLHEEDTQGSQEILLRAQAIVDSNLGPRFFAKDLMVGPPGVIQTTHFFIAHSHYIIFLSDTPSQPQLSGVTVYYRHDNGSFTFVQSILLVSPTSLAVFSFDSKWFLTVTRVTGRGRAGPNTQSLLYQWTGRAFRHTQDLGNAHGANNVQFVEVGVYWFLVLSCGGVHNSVVYLWFRGEFVFYQSLVTNSAVRVSAVQTPDSHFLLAFASPTKSTLFRWNGTYFALLKELNPFRELRLIVLSHLTLLVGVSDYEGGDISLMTAVYRLDRSGRLTVHTRLSTPGASQVEYVHPNSEHFLVIKQEPRGSSGSHTSLYRLDGASVIPFQRLPESGALSTFRTQEGCVKLLVSPFNSSITHPNTALYSWSSPTPCSGHTHS